MLANGIRQTTTTTGTGNLTLSVSGSYVPFSAKFASGTNGDPFFYAIIRASDGVGMEWGIGHLSDAATLVRDKILATWDGSTYNDQTPTAANLAAGTYNVECVDMSAARPIAPVSTDATASGTYRYVMPGQYAGNPAQSIGAAANTLWMVPYRLDVAATVAGISVKVNTASTSGTLKKLRAALYRMDNAGHPGTVIAEAATSIDIGTTGLKNLLFASSVHLDPGWYFVAICTDGTPSLAGTNSNAGAGNCPLWGVPGGDVSGRYITISKALTYADTGTLFPVPLGTTGLTYGVDWAVTTYTPTLLVTS